MKVIEEYKEKVNFYLMKFLEGKFDKNKDISPEVKDLIEDVIDYAYERGGKRVRPITLTFAYKCFKEGDEALKASIAIELMQAYLLIHDDIMDKSDLRRGKATIHEIYKKRYNEHMGTSMAILAGDLCFGYIYDAIADSGFGEKEKVEAMKHIGWILEREIYGQTLDLLLDFKEIKEEDVWKIYEYKTATYTMQGPIYLGCALAGVNDERVEKLQEYAYNVGVAFQIQDDINGIFGEVDKTGKPNVDDAKEGKKTLLIVKGLEMCRDEDKKFILKKWGDEKISEKEIEKIKKILKDCGALDYCKKKLDELIEKGKSSIKDVELRDEGKKFLLDMADYVRSLC